MIPISGIEEDNDRSCEPAIKGRFIVFSSSDPSGFKYRITSLKESRLTLSAMKQDYGFAWNLLSQKIKGLLGGKPPVIVHAYPVPVNNGSFGVTVLTYADPEQTAKAIRFAAQENTFAILTGMPLLIAEAIQLTPSLPPKMLLITGGYPMPLSLEKFIQEYCLSKGSQTDIMHAYGVAEIDAGLFFALSRTENGEPIYYPRDDVKYSIADSGALSVSIKSDGKWGNEQPTGDFASRHGNGIVISNPERVSKRIEDEFPGINWARKTGYVGLDDAGVLRWQLRRSFSAQDSGEMEHYDFMRQFGMRWISKPNWGISC